MRKHLASILRRAASRLDPLALETAHGPYTQLRVVATRNAAEAVAGVLGKNIAISYRRPDGSDGIARP